MSSPDSKDLLAYKMWLASSPFMVQQPPNHSNHSNHDRSMQLPTSTDQWPITKHDMNATEQWPTKRDKDAPEPGPVTHDKDATGDISPVKVLEHQSKRGRKKSVSTTGPVDINRVDINHMDINRMDMNRMDMFKALSAKLEDTDKAIAHLSSNGVDSELQRRLNSDVTAFPGSPKSLAACFQYGGVGDDLAQKQTLPRTVCQTCGKWFRSRQQLTQHMLVHTDVRKYRCNFCGRAFKQPSHLQQHHRIHTGEKPYRCPLAGCSRAFPQLSNLNHHLRNHDKPDPPTENTCLFCHRTYASEAVLKNHMAKIHLYHGDSPPKESSTANSSESPSPVSVTPAMTTSPKLAKGSYSEQLRNLASQPKVEENVTSGSLEDQLRADLIRAGVAGVMNSVQGESFANAMNAYQIFNTIPLEKIRRSQDLMNQHTAMNDVIASLSRAPSTESVAMNNALSPNVANAMSAISSLHSYGKPDTSVNVNQSNSPTSTGGQNAASSQDLEASPDKNSTNEYQAIRRSPNERLLNAAHSHTDMKNSIGNANVDETHNHKRAPVKLTSPGITTVGNDVAMRNVRNISVYENYRYTLENEGVGMADWKRHDELDNGNQSSSPQNHDDFVVTRIGSDVDDDDSDTSFSDVSAQEYDDIGDAGDDSECNIPKYSNISSNNAVETQHHFARIDGNVDLNMKRRKLGNGNEMGNGEESSPDEDSEHLHSIDTTAKCMRDEEAPYVMPQESDVIYKRNLASPAEPPNGNFHEFDKTRLCVGMKSNSRKRKAFQPQRVIYNGGNTD